MRRTLIAVAAVLGLLIALPALANPPPGAEPAAVVLDHAQTQRYMALLPQLRCMQCQNESLASSQAPWAQGVRARIRRMIAGGESDHQIKAFLVARYGQYVLYKPRFEPSTWLLWVGPFVLLVVGVAILLAVLLRRRQRAPRAERDSGQNVAHVRRWLEEEESDS